MDRLGSVAYIARRILEHEVYTRVLLNLTVTYEFTVLFVGNKSTDTLRGHQTCCDGTSCSHVDSVGHKYISQSAITSSDQYLAVMRFIQQSKTSDKTESFSLLLFERLCSAFNGECVIAK
jgi:hypothetical protein